MSYHYSNQHIIRFTLFNDEQPLHSQWKKIPISKGPKV
mgnify:CR=1 FL=1